MSANRVEGNPWKIKDLLDLQKRNLFNLNKADVVVKKGWGGVSLVPESV